MTELKLLETDRLVLSGWRADQYDDLVRLHGDPNVARFLRWHGAPWSEAEMRAALDSWIALFETRRMGKLRVTRKSDGVLVGRAGFGIYDVTGDPEIGYSMFPEFWGQGYALEASKGLRDWLFRETDLPRFLGFADVRNAPSISVLHRLGMVATHVGTLRDGQVCRFHVYERPKA